MEEQAWKMDELQTFTPAQEKAFLRLGAIVLKPIHADTVLDAIRLLGEYFITDMNHYSEAGHAVIANAILQQLEESGFRTHHDTNVWDWDAKDPCESWYKTERMLVDAGSDSSPEDFFMPEEDFVSPRFNKFNLVNEKARTYVMEHLPLNEMCYPISSDLDIITMLKHDTDIISVVDDKDDIEIKHDVAELIEIAGGLPDHPSPRNSAPYWANSKRSLKCVN